MNLPKVSVGVPVFNGEKYLEGCLRSILRQSFDDFEVVISDNHSYDLTEAICREFASRDSRIRYIRQSKNRGAAWNFNEVFRQSRGSYFKWQAYDDLCAPTFIEKCVEVLDQEPDVVWCHPLSIRLNATDERIPDPTEANPAHSVVPSNGIYSRQSDSSAKRFRAIMLGTPFTADIYGLIRREALQKTRLQLPFYGAEKPLLTELGLQGRFVEIPEVLCGIREHPDASGALETAQSQQEFVAPGHRGSALKTRLLLLKAYFTASLRHSLPLASRCLCMTAIAAYLLQIRKWSRVRSQLLKSRAVRGTGDTVTLKQQQSTS